jgi:Fe-S-cluster containining protein
MDQLQAILDNYRKLCDYCDRLWERVRKAYPNEIACRDGCGICCELRNVNRLEAHVIRSYIESINDKEIFMFASKSACPLLHGRSHSCLAYPARPTICRTHGLILRSTEWNRPQAASCPYNFPSYHPNDFPAELTVDVDCVTKNLTNLNLAFCMVMGIDIRDKNQERVPLKDLLP